MQIQIARNRSRTTKWNLFFQYATVGLALVSGIVLVPLYLRYIPLDLYGAWLATGNILAWLTVMDPGLSTVLQQRAGVAYGKGDVSELGALLTGGVFLSGIVALLVLVVGLISSRFLIEWLNLSPNIDLQILQQAFGLAVVGSSLMIFSYGLVAFNQGLQSSLGVGLVFVATMIASMVLTIILLYQGAGLLALPIGLIARGIGLTIGNTGYLVWRSVYEKLSYQISIRGISSLTRLSSYTFFGRTAAVFAANMDAFVLTRYLGPEMTPVFMLTRKAPDMSRMVVERPIVAFKPAIAHLVGAGELERAKVVLLRLMRITLWLLGLLAIGFIVFNRDFVSLWVGEDLFAGPAVNIIVVLALMISVLVNGLSHLCFSLGNIKGNSLVSLAQGLVSIPLLIIGAKYWGMIGVAIAPLVAMLLTTAWYFPWTFSHLLKLDRLDINAIAQETLVVLFAMIILASGFFWLNLTTWISLIIAVSIFSTIYALLISLFSQSFRSEMMGILKKARRRACCFTTP